MTLDNNSNPQEKRKSTKVGSMWVCIKMLWRDIQSAIQLRSCHSNLKTSNKLNKLKVNSS